MLQFEWNLCIKCNQEGNYMFVCIDCNNMKGGGGNDYNSDDEIIA